MRQDQIKEIILDIIRNEYIFDIFLPEKLRNTRTYARALGSISRDEKKELIWRYYENNYTKAGEKIELGEEDVLLEAYNTYMKTDKSVKMKKLINYKFNNDKSEKICFYTDDMYTVFLEKNCSGLSYELIDKKQNKKYSTKNNIGQIHIIENFLEKYLEENKEFCAFIEDQYDRICICKVLFDTYINQKERKEDIEVGLNIGISRNMAMQGLARGEVLVINSNRNHYLEDKIQLIVANTQTGEIKKIEIVKNTYAFFDSFSLEREKFNIYVTCVDNEELYHIFHDYFSENDIQALIPRFEVTSFWDIDLNEVDEEIIGFQSMIQNVINSTRGIVYKKEIFRDNALICYKVGERRDIYIYLEATQKKFSGIVNMKYLRLDRTGYSRSYEMNNLKFSDGKLEVTKDTILCSDKKEKMESKTLQDYKEKEREKCENLILRINNQMLANSREIRNNEAMMNGEHNLFLFSTHMDKFDMPQNLRKSILKMSDKKEKEDTEYLNDLFCENTLYGNVFLNYLRYKSNVEDEEIRKDNTLFCDMLAGYIEEETLSGALIRMGADPTNVNIILRGLDETFSRELFLVRSSNLETQIEVIRSATIFNETKNEAFNRGVFDINKIYPTFKVDIDNKSDLLMKKIDDIEIARELPVRGQEGIEVISSGESLDKCDVIINDLVAAAFYKTFQIVKTPSRREDNKKIYAFMHSFIQDAFDFAEDEVCLGKDEQGIKQRISLNQLMREEWDDVRTAMKIEKTEEILSKHWNEFPYESILIKKEEAGVDLIVELSDEFLEVHAEYKIIKETEYKVCIEFDQAKKKYYSIPQNTNYLEELIYDGLFSFKRKIY